MLVGWLVAMRRAVGGATPPSVPREDQGPRLDGAARPSVATMRRARTRLSLAAVALALISTLGVGCAATGDDPTTEASSASGSGATPAPPAQGWTVASLAELGAVEAIRTLETMPVEDRPALIASVRPEGLLLAEPDGSEEVLLDGPEDRFYLSVAPYRDRNHDCYFHSLTTCLGELGQTEVEVTIVDDATGEVLVSETRATHPNGFIDYWLPAGIEATVTITQGDTQGTHSIATGPEDLTCLTTLQLL